MRKKKEFLVLVKPLEDKDLEQLEEIICMNQAEKERQKKQKSRKRKNKRKVQNGYKMLIWTMLVIVTVIICSMLYMNYKICFPDDSVSVKETSQSEATCDTVSSALTDEQKAESTLLASGLAIIGLAISVWAGLNIIQVLEKGKLDALGKEVELYSKERCELNRRTFLNNILKLEDCLNGYLYKMFSQSEDESDNLTTLYFECNKIELQFQNVYGKQKWIERNIEVQYYIDAIDNTNRLLQEVENRENESKDIFIRYLKVRLAEFYFYKGYAVQADEVIHCFQKVLDYFYEVFEELKNPAEIMEKRYYLDGNKRLTLYMFNTLGEAYSKIIDGHNSSKERIKDFSEISKRLEDLYMYAIELIEKRHPNNKEGYEVYYRNYGCALERINKYNNGFKNKFENLETFQKIKSLYQKAIDEVLYGNKEKLREQTFQVYVSLYYKYIHDIGIAECLESNSAKYDRVENMIDELEQYTSDVDFYVNLAMNITPLNIYFWKIKAFVERDYTIWAIIKHDKKNAKRHYIQFKEWWERIRQAEERKERKSDEMCKELMKGLEVLEKHFR